MKADEQEKTPEWWNEMDELIQRPFSEVGLVCLRGNSDFDTRFNIKQSVVRHSPTGMEWGYNGSGPSDLALNLACLLLKTTGKKGARIQEGNTSMPRLATYIYIDLRNHFISSLHTQGGHIPLEALNDWMRGQFEKWGDCGAVLRFETAAKA